MRRILDRPEMADRIFSRMRWGNAFGADRLDDPYIAADEMLDDGYVTFHKSYRQWFVLGYAEAQEALRSPSFGVGERVPMLRSIRPYSQLNDETGDTITNWVIFQDPPDHTRLRRLIARWFTPRQVEELRPRIQQLVDSLILDMHDDIAAGNTIEIMSRFCNYLPVNIVADIMGMPEETWPRLKALSDQMAAVLDPIRGFDPKVMDDHFATLRTMILKAAEERRRQPTDDLMSALVAVEEDGDQLSTDELVSMAGFLLLAGHETTTSGLGLGLLSLARFPDERAKWRANPDLTENAVEELLRYDTPVPVIGRNALEDVELGGRHIKKGDLLVASMGMANRDKRRFADADVLRLDRPDPRPLSFGNGIHHCVGAALARLELQVALPSLLSVLGDYTIDRSAVEWRPIISLRSPRAIPLVPSSAQ